MLTSYLFNRFQYTVNREEQVSSGLLPISVGVSQGSMLGPFLFLVYINDLPNACESKTVLYADDSVLLCTDVNTEKLSSKVNVKIRFFNLKIGLIRTDLR